MVLLRQDVNLGAGQLFPFADTLVERLILLSADKLGVDRYTVELSRQICTKCSLRAENCDDASRNTDQQIFHGSLP